VVRIHTRRRWAAVAAGVAVLCALPVLASALPVTVPPLSAAQLRARILGSADMSYAGYAESNATFGLPALSGLNSVTTLLDGVTKMRVWEAAPDRWRVDVLADAGEKDTYQLGTTEYLWDSDAQLLTEVIPGPAADGTLRLPRAADLTPPALALRLLSLAGLNARYQTIPPLRVAGQAAAGLRVTPSDPASTVGQIDIWAAPATGLPLMVEVFARNVRGVIGRAALQTQFFEVGPWQPVSSVLTPVRGPGTGFTVADAASLTGALNNLAPSTSLPAYLAGRHRIPPPPGLRTVGLYGGGLATFAVLTVNSGSLMADALAAGGTQYRFADGTGVLVGASLLNAVIARSDRTGTVFLITGTVSAKVLLQAATALTGAG
jgi:hypothetical protein